MNRSGRVIGLRWTYFAAAMAALCLPAIHGPVAAQNPKADAKSKKADAPKAETAKEAASKADSTESSGGADPLDWPNWRGPEQNGVSRETGLIDKWDEKQLLWKKPELATRSTPIVMRGKLYTLASSEPGTEREGEQVICADAATGEILWQNRFNVYLSDVPKERVGWSCCVGDPATGHVYALGVGGYFQCIDGETGDTVWSHSMSEEYGLLSTYGGRTNVPVVFEDLVIISGVVIGWGEMAVPAHRFIAFNKSTGEAVWFNGTRERPTDTTYSTPILTVLGGQAAMVFGSGDGSVWAFQPRTGVPIWNYRLSQRGLNVTPLVDGDTVYMGQSEENTGDSSMGAFAAINGVGDGDITKSGEIWRHRQVMVGKCSPVLVDGRIYAMEDSNILHLFEAESGKQLGKTRLTGTISRASPLYADGKIYACTLSAWHVLNLTKDGVKVADRKRFSQGEEVHGSPIVSHGRLYLPTTSNMYCFSTGAEKPTATERPAPVAEQPVGDNKQPAHVQVTPVESLLAPGEMVEYKARLFNDRGQLLGDADGATFAADKGGEFNEQGQFTAADDARHVGVVITAKSDELEGTARARIVPPLPWEFDFDKVPLVANKKTMVEEGEPPVTWIGLRYRHKIREVAGEKVMVKITTIPLGTRSQGWMGPPDLHDYTIQADVSGAIEGEQMPDIGLIAQRYTLDLMGNSKQLQIRSWVSELHRFSKTVKFDWKPDTWYTMKFQAAVEDGNAVLRGKVWPRGQGEPTEWTIEATDTVANLTGSPGLFGNAGNAEIYLDNIRVTPNAAGDDVASQDSRDDVSAGPTKSSLPAVKGVKE